MPAPSRAVDDASARPAANRRVLVVDDNRAIHGDFRKVLGEQSHDQSALAELEAMLFGQGEPGKRRAAPEPFLVDSAYQGHEAQEAVRKAREAGKPYAVAFVDMRMPGWDGIETIAQLLRVQPDLQVAICSAYMITPGTRSSRA